MPEGENMWALQYHRHGAPEVLGVGSVRRPRPGRGEVLVEVAAFSVNVSDLLARQGKTRVLNGFGFPKGSGVDFAGVVAEVGSGAEGFDSGDRVWGYIGMKPPGRAAAGAQFVAVPARRISRAPIGVPLEEAAALPLVGLTALQGLRKVGIASGAQVLVVGGNGGVGSTAIQIAVALGATVEAVVGDHGASLATAAGASRTYSYHSTTPKDLAGSYDIIFDTAANDLAGYRRLLVPGGKLITVSPSGITAILTSFVTPGPVVRMVSGKPSREDLGRIAEQVNAGKIRPLIAKKYTVAQASEAHKDAETQSAHGKRVIVTDLI